VAPGPLARARRRVGSWRIGAILFVLYLLLAALFWRTLVWQFDSASLGAGSGDAGLFISWLQWAAHAVTNGLNPLRNDYLQAPFGVSAVWNTSILALGIPLIPVTLLFGAAASFNVVLLLSPVLAAWTASKWLRRHVDTVPAAIGGLVYGFSPFEIGQLAGHAHLTFLALVPLIVMCLEDLIVRSERPLWPTAPLLGLAVAVQYFISSEILLMLAISLVPAVILLAAGRWDVTRQRVSRVLVAGLVAVGTAAVLLAYPLSEQFSKTYRIDVAVQDWTKHVAQVGYLFTPTVALFFHGSSPSPDPVENGTFIGWPMLAVLLITVVVLRRRLAVWVAVLMAGFAVVSELDLHVFGVSVSVLARLQRRVELTASIVPMRLSSVFALAAAFLVALGVQELLRAWPRHRWVSIVGGALVLVTLGSWLPGNARPVGPLIGTPAFFTSQVMRQIIPEHSIAMVAPMANPSNMYAEFWQVRAGMWFKQLGGYDLNNQGTGIPSFKPRQSTLLRLFGASWAGRAALSPTELHQLMRAGRIELADSGATFFIAVPHYLGDDQQRDFARKMLGRPADRAAGGAQIWSLTQRCGQDPSIGPVCPTGG
jgi:hypothetical protein